MVTSDSNDTASPMKIVKHALVSESPTLESLGSLSVRNKSQSSVLNILKSYHSKSQVVTPKRQCNEETASPTPTLPRKALKTNNEMEILDTDSTTSKISLTESEAAHIKHCADTSTINAPGLESPKDHTTVEKEQCRVHTIFATEEIDGKHVVDYKTSLKKTKSISSEAVTASNKITRTKPKDAPTSLKSFPGKRTAVQ